MDEQQLLSRLFELAPPPAHLIATRGENNDWVSVERAIGTALPTDYKAIIDRYGSGDFLDLLILLNPFCDKDDLNLIYQVGTEPDVYGPMIESYNQARFGAYPDECPFSVYPEPGGLFPVGVESVGRDLYWLTEGDPVDWTLVRYEIRGGWLCERFEVGLVEFLVDWLGREVPRISGLPGAGEKVRISPVFCPIGVVRDYAKKSGT